MESEVEKLTRLLIIDEGPHKAEQITSSLRAIGMQVRAEFAEDSEDMCAMLTNKVFDLVLFSIDLADFTLKQAQHLISECGRHVFLVAMTDKLTTEVTVQSISGGARDVVSSSNPDHLILVVKREIHNLLTWRKAKRMELELMESEQRCQSLLANSKDAVAYVHEGMHIYANQVYIELFGYTGFEELEGTPIIDMVHDSQQNEIKTFLRALSQNENDSNQLDLKLIDDSGDIIEATLEFSRASYDGEPCTQILIRTSTDTSELEEQINYLHQHDPVSGLYNRQYFMDELKSSITKATNGINCYAIIYVAIDNFQTILDTVGIAGGDILIGDIAKILQNNAGEGQTVARFGAYSYAFLTISTDKKAIEDFAAGIPVLVGQHISETGNQSISATCSASVCFVDENSPDNPNEIIARAEKTCDQAQKEGGNRSRAYVPKAGEMTQEEEDGIIVELIKSALADNRIEGLYQPIGSTKAEGGERYLLSLALYDEKGVRLADYQAAAERTGIAKTLDRWAILHAIKKIAQASKKSQKIDFFIPLSMSSVLGAGLTPWISDNLSKAHVSGQQLIFMINENHAVNQLKASKSLSKGLQKIHCRVGLDEFGGGLNPFQLLKHISVDFVSINLAYMENLAQNSENQDSIRELSAQASEINVRTIAPGVNDAVILGVLCLVPHKTLD